MIILSLRLKLLKKKASLLYRYYHLLKVSFLLLLIWPCYCDFAVCEVGSGQKKEKHLTKPVVGHFRAQGVPMKRKLREFPFTEDALLPVGICVGVRHFVPGQFVDVAGITMGWYEMPDLKEGQQVTVRPYRIEALVLLVRGMLLGRYLKMPGRMGGVQRTVKNVWVYKIDPARNLMWVKGQVPGAEGNFVFIKDSVCKKPDIQMLPFQLTLVHKMMIMRNLYRLMLEK
ncbi:hypothetical protein OIU79_003818 [Salix purpurea]|uniref:Uncharacterized protein n=1 Tax=Salix purpurea TaxID=77065 RepID=A0A9Q0U8R5_SALPP|nr:hypothetical protein OIU79_003818 [Salix purpurea]